MPGEGDPHGVDATGEIPIIAALFAGGQKHVSTPPCPALLSGSYLAARGGHAAAAYRSFIGSILWVQLRGLTKGLRFACGGLPWPVDLQW